MKSSIISLIFSSLILFANTVNPISQAYYTADPACLVDKGVFYVYTGHDVDWAKNWYEMPDWLVFSSTDMQNWVNHGPVLLDSEFKWAPKNGAWAAQVIERKGKYYYYVTLNESAGSKIGVAVGDSPLGPFKDALGKALIDGPWHYIDPTVFIDDDGQAYLYFGNGSLWYVKLNEDMISINGKVETVQFTVDSFGKGEGNMKSLYNEAPWLMKRDGVYYMVYACTALPQSICYSTANSATGPWKYRGVIMPEGQKGQAITIHPAICDFKNRSYYVYHTARLPGGNDYHRSAAVEEFKYKSDGSFPTINFSDEGPEQVEHLDPFKKTPAYTINFEQGIKIHTDYGYPFVAEIQNGDYIKVKGVDFKDGATKFTVRVASGTQGGNIELRVDKKDGQNVGTCKVPNTGDWTEWKTIDCECNVSSVHDLFLVFTGGDGYLFDFEWWQFA